MKKRKASETVKDVHVVVRLGNDEMHQVALTADEQKAVGEVLLTLHSGKIKLWEKPLLSLRVVNPTEELT